MLIYPSAAGGRAYMVRRYSTSVTSYLLQRRIRYDTTRYDDDDGTRIIYINISDTIWPICPFSTRPLRLVSFPMQIIASHIEMLIYLYTKNNTYISHTQPAS